MTTYRCRNSKSSLSFRHVGGAIVMLCTLGSLLPFIASCFYDDASSVYFDLPTSTEPNKRINHREASVVLEKTKDTVVLNVSTSASSPPIEKPSFSDEPILTNTTTIQEAGQNDTATRILPTNTTLETNSSASEGQNDSATLPNVTSSLNHNTDDALAAIQNTQPLQPHSTSSDATFPLKGLRLVFVGDSLTRFMYLSLVYYLAYGHWAPRDHPITQKVKGPTWNDWLAESNSYLSDYEDCDCYRNTGRHPFEMRCENRYFFTNETQGDHQVLFFTRLETHPFHGHWNATDISTHERKGLVNQTAHAYAWSLNTWSDFVEQYLVHLNPRPNMFIFNEGFWPKHDLGDIKVVQSLKESLEKNGIRGIYRTTTSRHDQTDFAKIKDDKFHAHEEAVCQVFECLNMSWSVSLDRSDYHDELHFKSAVYTRMNLQFFEEILGLDVSSHNITAVA